MNTEDWKYNELIAETVDLLIWICTLMATWTLLYSFIVNNIISFHSPSNIQFWNSLLSGPAWAKFFMSASDYGLIPIAWISAEQVGNCYWRAKLDDSPFINLLLTFEMTSWCILLPTWGTVRPQRESWWIFNSMKPHHLTTYESPPYSPSLL